MNDHPQILEIQAQVLCRLLKDIGNPPASGRLSPQRAAQLHWFTHSKKLVRICNEEGIYVSVGPTAIHDEQTQGVACEIDRELLLLETDAPVPIGGVQGHPARVRAVAEKLAELRGLEMEELAALTAANAERYLGGAP